MALGLTACYEDKGNYNYSDINEIAVDTTVTEYYVNNTGTLTINPEITSTKNIDASNYSYEWKWVAKGQATVISTSRNLSFVVKQPSGKYNLYFVITDHTTGLQWQQAYKVNVRVPYINEGYLLLCEVDNGTRLDMISYDKATDMFFTLPSVLDSAGSNFKPQGKPLQVVCFPASPTLYNSSAKEYGIYILTDQNTNRIDPEDFSYDPLKHDISVDFITGTPAGFKADAIYGGNNRIILLGEGNMYPYYNASSIKFGYEAPGNVINGVANKVFPKIGFGAVTTSGNSALFDMDNKRFMGIGSTQSRWSPYTSGATLFPWTLPDSLNLVTIEKSTLLSNLFYAVLKSITGVYYVGAFRANSQVLYQRTDISGDISLFAPSVEQQSWIFYAKGSKVYRCNLNTGMSTEVLDKGNNVITCLYFHHFLSYSIAANATTYNVWNKKLMVGSYDSSGTEGANGTLDLFTVTTTDGTLEPYSQYTGLGKIKSITYRER